MTSLHMIVNVLHPGRRERRYYLAELLKRYARDGVPIAQWPNAVGVGPVEFQQWCNDSATIPAWVRSIAVVCYHVRPPSRSYLYVPLAKYSAWMLLAAGIFAWSVTRLL